MQPDFTVLQLTCASIAYHFLCRNFQNSIGKLKPGLKLMVVGDSDTIV